MRVNDKAAALVVVVNMRLLPKLRFYFSKHYVY